MAAAHLRDHACAVRALAFRFAANVLIHVQSHVDLS